MAKDIQSLLPAVQAAVSRYQMIQEGDTIAVGVSGGKDSLVLLVVLARLQKFYPVPFSLKAITLDPQFNGPADYSAIQTLCDSLKVPYIVRRTHLWDAVVSEGQEDHPCSLCAKMRRGALHKTAVEEGCNVVALGHHENDAAETFFMNLMSGGTISCFSPVTHLDRRQITLIRPLIFLSENQIEGVAKAENLPIVKSACPADGVTSRFEARREIERLSCVYKKDISKQIVGALQKNHISGW